MKIVWVAIISLAVLLGVSFLVFNYSSAIFNDLQANLERLEQAVEDEIWEKADRETETLGTLWNRADDIWTPIMDHREVDRLDESLTRVKRLVQLRSREEALLEIVVSKRLMTRLKDNEVPGIGNVF